MARYTGPKHRLSRREGVNLAEKSSQSLIRRLNNPPGMHGGKRARRRLSEFGQQLREKQKAKVTYGLLEKQFRNLVKAVQKKKGDTQELILATLETRLDNVVYRLGFAKTRYQSRQLVSHGHILVNGKKINIPSYQVLQDDVISLSSKMQSNPQVLKTLEEKKEVIGFLKREALSGKLTRVPTKDDVQAPFNTQLIIEYYSR